MSQTFNSFLGTGWAFPRRCWCFHQQLPAGGTGIVFFSQYRMISSGQ